MDPYDDLATDTMQTMLRRTPVGFQLPSISHILWMMSGKMSSGPVLIVQPTGSGKSSVPLTCAAVDYGVTIVVENSLSLGVDQAVKAKMSF